jgi:hypothetical protein
MPGHTKFVVGGSQRDSKGYQPCFAADWHNLAITILLFTLP